MANDHIGTQVTPRKCLHIWKDIEKTYGEQYNIHYEGARIVGLDGESDDWYDAIDGIDRLCKKLQQYKNELLFFYGDEVPKTRSVQATYIYVMADNHTGRYKIGRSQEPKYREKTLKAEKPDISLIFTSPPTSPSTEKELHKIFKSKRVRGEWFDLANEDLVFIKNFNYGFA